jgi:superfamily II DNA or RNA helicase
VDCIVILRPTKNPLPLSADGRRGMRLAPGKDHLLLLDFLWMTGKARPLQTVRSHQQGREDCKDD